MAASTCSQGSTRWLQDLSHHALRKGTLLLESQWHAKLIKISMRDRKVKSADEVACKGAGVTLTASDKSLLPSVPWLKPKMALCTLSYEMSPEAMEVAASTCSQGSTRWLQDLSHHALRKGTLLLESQTLSRI